MVENPGTRNGNLLVFINLKRFFLWPFQDLYLLLDRERPSIRRKGGENPEWCKTESFSNFPQTLNIWREPRGGGQPRQWEPLSLLSTPGEQPCHKVNKEACVCVLTVCVWTNGAQTRVMLNRRKVVQGATVICLNIFL